MALKQLPPNWAEMALADREQWWLANVYRGDMPQLTLRAGLTGAIVGALLSLVNLYIGIKTGFAVGMGVTSVVLAFMAFGILSRLGVAKQITILENNAVQSTATAAGYMTGMVTASLPAYMMVTNTVFPMWAAIVWAALLAVLGVLFAFPWKRRFINSGDYPFPEGSAAAVVMDGIHSDDPKDAIKGKVLGIGALFSGIWAFITSSRYAFLPDAGLNWLPKINGFALQNWSVNVGLDAALIGIGGIVGLRTALSWFLGAAVNYLLLVPLLIHFGMIVPPDGKTVYDIGFRAIVSWSMWPGVAIVTASSLYPFITNFDQVRSAFRGTSGSSGNTLEHIELPMSVFYMGIPAVSLLVLVMGNLFFGIHPFTGFGAILLIGVFTLIAINSTALTSYTPSSALAKLSQVYAAVVSPGNIGVNVSTGSISSEVTSNAANLLMDIRAGWLLGAKPRQQAVAHIIGAIVGSWSATTAFYSLFNGDISKFGSDSMPLPGAMVWKGLADVLSHGLSAVPTSARLALLIGAVVGVTFAWLDDRSKAHHNKPFFISATAFSLGFIVQFHVAAAVALGAVIFALGDVAGKRNLAGWLNRIITSDEKGVSLASGLIAGAGLAGLLILLFAAPA